MKLHLSFNGTPKNGWINIDPIPKTIDNVSSEYANLDDLNKLIDDSEVEELWVDNVINFIADYDLEEHLQHWINKLRHGAIIHIDSTDLYTIGIALVSGTITQPYARFLLYGQKGLPPKMSSYDIFEIEKLLNNMGIKIIKKTSNDFYWTITGKRE